MKPRKKTIPDNWPALIASGGQNDGAVAFMSGPRGDRLIGSGVDSHLLIAAPNVETAHASVRWNEVGVFLDDLSKEKGTFLNGERFDQSCALGNGDRIWLGPPGDHDSVKITVQLPDHPMQFEPAHTPSLEDAPEDAPAAASDDASEEWGAMDDDENLIPAAAAKGAKGTTGKLPKVSPPPPPASVQKTPSAKGRSFSMPSAPPLSRAVLVGIGAVVLAGGAFWYFRSAQAGGPSLVSIHPPKAETGQTVQIVGNGFEASPEANTVSFGDKTAQVTTAAPSELSVVVPAGLTADAKIQHKVRVASRGKQSNAIYFQIYAGPRVTGLEPDVAMPGDTVTAAGENFGASDMKVSVAGINAEVIDSQPAALKFKVPALATPPGKSVSVNVQSGALSSRPASLIVGKLPLVLEVTPSRGLAGDRATIKGRGFDPATGGSQVSFGGRAALVLGASATELQVLVPGRGPGSPAELPVTVRSAGALSTSTLVFTLTRSSTAAFLPRFFAEPGTGPEAVVVSSELGPFLRLSGKADSTSAAERGARVAAALNGLFEKASRGPVSIEYREKPEPAVIVAGSDAPLVVATASDGPGYEGGRPSPRALGRFWTALVQDYVALFAQRTRPFRVLEISPRGQALLDLFVAAERRGAGAGIPASAIENLPAAQLGAFAEMAMSVPGGDAPAAAGAAVAGRWDGTLEETGTAPRAIQVRMQTRGAQLSGSFTMRSGAISAELPLENAGYRDGALNFTITYGARALRFTGKVDGRTVAGVVESKDAKPVGRFSLRWVD